MQSTPAKGRTDYFSLAAETKEKLHRLETNLIWPAIAGNVAWSLITVALDPVNFVNAQKTERLFALSFMALYLVVNWLMAESRDGKDFDGAYWVGDFLHVAAIATFSILIQVKQTGVNFCLAVLLAGTALGHLTRIWQPTKKKSSINGFILGACNVVGIFVLMSMQTYSGKGVTDYFANDSVGMETSYAIGAVLFLWGIAWLKRVRSS